MNHLRRENYFFLGVGLVERRLGDYLGCVRSALVRDLIALGERAL